MYIEGNSKSDAANALATLYPALLGTARIYIARYGTDRLEPEDLVQETIARWFASEATFESAGKMFTWLATTMRRVTHDATVRSEDMLDQRPLSLDEFR